MYLESGNCYWLKVKIPQPFYYPTILIFWMISCFDAKKLEKCTTLWTHVWQNSRKSREKFFYAPRVGKEKKDSCRRGGSSRESGECTTIFFFSNPWQILGDVFRKCHEYGTSMAPIGTDFCLQLLAARAVARARCSVLPTVPVANSCR